MMYWNFNIIYHIKENWQQLNHIELFHKSWSKFHFTILIHMDHFIHSIFLIFQKNTLKLQIMALLYFSSCLIKHLNALYALQLRNGSLFKYSTIQAAYHKKTTEFAFVISFKSIKGKIFSKHLLTSTSICHKWRMSLLILN